MVGIRTTSFATAPLCRSIAPSRRRPSRALAPLALAASLLACARTEPPREGQGPAAPGPSQQEPSLKELTWTLDASPIGPTTVVVAMPARPEGRLPVLVAFHGRGEAMKERSAGARGWLDDYGMARAIERLRAPPLTDTDLGGMSTGERLGRINSSLASRPYRGLIVVCPYTPDLLAGDRDLDAARPLAELIVREVLPRVYRETAAIGTAETTGIDGVSLGGRAALLVGFEHPEAFGAIAALQAALRESEAPAFAARARAAMAKNPKLRLRLLTSDDDALREENLALSRALADAGVRHELLEVAGNHSYAFNRGPGVYEMLLFHDRALRSD